MRSASESRRTNETDVSVSLTLDGTGRATVATGIGFLDHMLELLARHALFDLDVKVTGDLHVDHHHTTEDAGIALGTAFARALGDKRGVARYASVDLPMDETLTRVALDLSGRAFLVFRTTFPTEKIGVFDTQLVREFFQAFAMNAGITLHVETVYGDNSHHIAESCFKGLARALRAAVAIDGREGDRIPSTKGAL
ncbi:MAG: hisB [Enterovirga sp.]|jgi:imidazoleglycerol-phosphate dehydratase|nr:hisB [Enterovirga sp.]